MRDRKEYSRQHYLKNKEKILAKQKIYREENAARLKANKRKHKVKHYYGITEEEYIQRMGTSDKCEICSSMKDLCYDHNHDTMAFRGVLCGKCNRGIGLLGDDVEGVIKALQYLTKEK